MKGVLVVIDGLGGLPHSLLEGKTALDAARTLNMDFFASRGELGYMYTVNPGFVPESDEAIVSIFGNNQIASTRGQLEARGAGIKLTRGDLAFRVNFGSIDSYESGNILDRRVRRTLSTKEAEILAKAINKIKLPVKFEFKATVQHRGALVFRGGFSDNVSGNDLTYNNGQAQSQNKIMNCRPLDDDENSVYTSNIVNEFLEKAYEILNEHPVNQSRVEKGLLPANYLFLRGAGIEPPTLKQYPKWVSVNYMPMEIGFSKFSGMKNFSFDYPKLKSLDAYENLWKGLRKACKYAIKIVNKNSKKYDYVYIHIKETDLPGHDNKPLEKKLMLEYIDITLFKFLRKFCPPKKIKVVVTGDHSTPCRLKAHSADPVPVLLYKAEEVKPEEKSFCEREARIGSLGRMVGNEFLGKVGFDK